MHQCVDVRRCVFYMDPLLTDDEYPVYNRICYLPFDICFTIWNLPQFFLLENLDSSPAQRLCIQALFHLAIRALTKHVSHQVLANQLSTLASRPINDLIRCDTVEKDVILQIIFGVDEVERINLIQGCNGSIVQGFQT